MIHLPARAAASALLVVCASLVVIGGCAQAQAPDDAALALRGQRLFLRCASCHDVSGSATQLVPDVLLWIELGRVGRQTQ